MNRLTSLAAMLRSVPMEGSIISRCSSLLQGIGNTRVAFSMCSNGTNSVFDIQFRRASNSTLGQLEQSQAIDQDQHANNIIDPATEILKHDYFGVRRLTTIRDLYNAGVHLGHKKGLREPYMNPFIFGTRLGVDVIDLDITSVLLGDALNFLAHVAYREGIVLFISRHKRTIPYVERTAQECGEYAHCRLWRGGTFTNSTIQYGAVTRLPDVCVFLSMETYAFRQHVAITEAAKMNIPSIGVVDTNSDPRLITYPIPGNDDTPSAIQLYLDLFAEAIRRGKNKRKEHQKTGIVS